MVDLSLTTVPDEQINNDEDEEINMLAEILAIQLGHVDDDQDSVEDEEIKYSQVFAIVGSWFEQRYQQGLAICSYAKGQKDVEIRVQNEPDNIRDTNAIKFEVFIITINGIFWDTVVLKKYPNCTRP